MITNHCTSPDAAVIGSYSWNLTRQLVNGKWVVAVSGTYPRGSLSFCGACRKLDTGDVIVIVFDCDHPEAMMGIEDGSTYRVRDADVIAEAVISDTRGWIAAKITDASKINHELVIGVTAGQLTVQAVANYTPADWEKVHALYESGILPTPWVAGHLLPDSQ